MSPPSGSAGLPPYASSSIPASASASASPLTPTPTQRKTVRFQTASNGYDESHRRTSKPAPPPGVLPTAYRGDHYGTHGVNTAGPHVSGGHFPHIPPGGGANSHGGTTSGPPSYDGSEADSHEAAMAAAADDDDGQVARPTLLQPRVAVVLGLPSLWNLPLFACRSLSVCPAIWWSLGIFIRLLAQLHALAIARGVFGVAVGPHGATTFTGDAAAVHGGLAIHDRSGLSLESRLKLTETALAMIWCGASAYLSFFFTDCLMSRWLLNYTPQATIVRLLAINALNGYLTSWVIYLMGSGCDSRLLLPAWVAIAAILTALYHVTQRKINIRKETSISISVFSGASFISMAALLSQLYWDRPEYVDVPVVALTRRVFAETARLAGNIFDIGNITMDL